MRGASYSRCLICLSRFGFLAGLPRTGSTLLTCILGQNPDVHVSGGSPLARLMFAAHDGCENYASEGLVRVRRTDFKDVLLTEIPRLYYKDVTQKYILDKDRAWGHDPLGFLDYIADRPRVVVLLRSIPEIVESFVRINTRNGDMLPERNFLEPGVDPLLDALRNTMKALQSGDDRFLFGTYDQLLTSPERFVDAVYRHYGWEPYGHNFAEITDLNLEDDEAFHTQGLHEVRPTIQRRPVNVKVSIGLMNEARRLDDLLWDQVRISLRESPHRHI
jgi:sulfotransferase